MNAIDLLEEQHRLVEDLFEQFEKAEGRAEKTKVFMKIAANLCAHDAIEREIFYPACERALGADEEILAESLVEHGLVEFSIFRANQAKSAAPHFDEFVTVLKEIVEHHVEEEEKELFPKIKRAFKSAELEALGTRMQDRFTAVMGKDFEPALVENIRQLLLGRMKTTGSKRAPRSTTARSLTTPKKVRATPKKARASKGQKTKRTASTRRRRTA